MQNYSCSRASHLWLQRQVQNYGSFKKKRKYLRGKWDARGGRWGADGMLEGADGMLKQPVHEGNDRHSFLMELLKGALQQEKQ